MSTEFESMVAETFAQLGKALNESIAAWREAHGIPEWADPGYIGQRSGWYPTKPPRAFVRAERRRC